MQCSCNDPVRQISNRFGMSFFYESSFLPLSLRHFLRYAHCTFSDGKHNNNEIVISETSCIAANPCLRLATIQRHKIKQYQGYMLNSSERCKSHPNSYSNSRYYKPSTWIMSMMHYVTFPILTPTARKKSIFNEALPTKISDCWGYERTQIRISASPHDRR